MLLDVFLDLPACLSGVSVLWWYWYALAGGFLA